MSYYILKEDNEIEEVEDMTAWAEWRKDNAHKCCVANDRYDKKGFWPFFRKDHVVISTVFVGLTVFDDAWGAFETIVFDKNGDAIIELRYSTYKEAFKGHSTLRREYKFKLNN